MAAVTLTIVDEPGGTVAVRVDSDCQINYRTPTPAERLALAMIALPVPEERT